MTLESKFIVEKRVKVPFSAMEWISDLFPTTQSKNKFWKENQSHIIQGGIRLTDVSGGDWYLYRSSNRNQKFLLNVIYTDSKGRWIVMRNNWTSGNTLFSAHSSSINAQKFVILTNMSTLELKGANLRTTGAAQGTTGGDKPPISKKNPDYWNWRSSWGSGGRGEYIKIDRPITNFINWTQHPFDEVKE